MKSIKKIIDWLDNNKISVGFVGMALVISTQYATCTLEPTLGQEEPQEEGAE
tara:strand:+ start:2961 stop:3116 length:156 start_codon:yes stop_codon:yes gene_type:complete